MIVYIETTVWSFAFADDSPDFTRSTLAFFAGIQSAGVQPIISALVLTEIRRSGEPVRSQLLDLVRRIGPRVVPDAEASLQLADDFLKVGAVPPSKPDDAAHVAAAFVAGADVLVSWNFKHITNVRRAQMFNAAAQLRGFRKPLTIVTPAEVISGNEP